MSSYNNAISFLLSFLAASVNQGSRCRFSGFLVFISLIEVHGALLSRTRDCSSFGMWHLFSLSLKRRSSCTWMNGLFFFSLSWMADGLGFMISNNLMLHCLSISAKTSDQLRKSSNWIVMLMTAIITLRPTFEQWFYWKKCFCMWLTTPYKIPNVA